MVGTLKADDMETDDASGGVDETTTTIEKNEEEEEEEQHEEEKVDHKVQLQKLSRAYEVAKGVRDSSRQERFLLVVCYLMECRAEKLSLCQLCFRVTATPYIICLYVVVISLHVNKFASSELPLCDDVWAVQCRTAERDEKIPALALTADV